MYECYPSLAEIRQCRRRRPTADQDHAYSYCRAVEIFRGTRYHFYPFVLGVFRAVVTYLVVGESPCRGKSDIRLSYQPKNPTRPPHTQDPTKNALFPGPDLAQYGPVWLLCAMQYS